MTLSVPSIEPHETPSALIQCTGTGVALTERPALCPDGPPSFPVYTPLWAAIHAPPPLPYRRMGHTAAQIQKELDLRFEFVLGIGQGILDHPKATVVGPDPEPVNER